MILNFQGVIRANGTVQYSVVENFYGTVPEAWSFLQYGTVQGS